MNLTVQKAALSIPLYESHLRYEVEGLDVVTKKILTDSCQNVGRTVSRLRDVTEVCHHVLQSERLFDDFWMAIRGAVSVLKSWHHYLGITKHWSSEDTKRKVFKTFITRLSLNCRWVFHENSVATYGNELIGLFVQTCRDALFRQIELPLPELPATSNSFHYDLPPPQPLPIEFGHDAPSGLGFGHSMPPPPPEEKAGLSVPLSGYRSRRHDSRGHRDDEDDSASSVSSESDSYSYASREDDRSEEASEDDDDDE